ncbi:LysM peptidoglycan-binding domain-containing protein [Flavobacterium sp. TSSA_36]|uniref:peptidoglycan endopeptidase n=1 Tax=Flavobacterium sp. TSSA_36 TaxID=3447669 RepID=UPI003F2B8D56
MRYFGLIFWLFVMATSSVFSQEKFIKHAIAKGETISSIAEKYQVSQKVIFELNPNASGILKLNAILKIPNKSYKKEIAKKQSSTKQKKTQIVAHEVIAKETLFGIAKKYAISVGDIKKSNPSIELEGLKVGQQLKLVLPDNFVLPQEVAEVEKDSMVQRSAIDSNQKETLKATTSISTTPSLQLHTVMATETKYGVSKKYNLSVAELEQLNPTLVNKKLAIGQVLNVPLLNNNQVAIQSTTLESTDLLKEEGASKTEMVTTTASPQALNESIVTKTAEHVVIAKETKFGIAKKYNITLNELERLNPSIQNTLRVGMVLKVGEGTLIPTDAALLETTKNESLVTADESTTKIFGDFAVADHLIEKASDNLGVRYRSGGTTRAGFDCSGLMFTTFDAFDIKLPRSSIEQANVGLKIDPLEAKKGDLIFFKTRGSGRINHVGMVIDVAGDEIKFIHSSTSNGVIISSTKENYYHRNFAQVNRVLK